jgi:hypothetical protein
MDRNIAASIICTVRSQTGDCATPDGSHTAEIRNYVLDSFPARRVRVIRLMTMIWSTIQDHRRCPVPWVASGIEAGTVELGGDYS